MTYSEIAKKYCEDIVNGTILSSNLVKLACQRHLDDLVQQNDSTYPFQFDSKLADKRCAFSMPLNNFYQPFRSLLNVDPCAI